MALNNRKMHQNKTKANKAKNIYINVGESKTNFARIIPIGKSITNGNADQITIVIVLSIKSFARKILAIILNNSANK
jgi:hypothetical protein